MRRGLHFFVVCLVAAGLVRTPVPLRAGEPKEVKIIASASEADPLLVQLKKDDSGVVIRSAQELVALSKKADSAKDAAVQKAMEAELAKLLKVQSIDWSKHMILAVQGRPTKGEWGTIKFGSLKIEGMALSVPWKQENRATRAPYQGPPTGFCLVERFDGDVKFVPLTPPKEPAKEMTNSIG